MFRLVYPLLRQALERWWQVAPKLRRRKQSENKYFFTQELTKQKREKWKREN